MVCFPAAPGVSLALSDERLTGVLALTQKGHRAVSKAAVQTPPEGSGIDTFPFWLPARRPAGKNLALELETGIAAFGPANLTSGPDRPEDAPNAWLADPDDQAPWAELAWAEPRTIRRCRIQLRHRLRPSDGDGADAASRACNALLRDGGPTA